MFWRKKMNKVLRNNIEASIMEERLEQTQRQKSILELLLTQEDANFLINKLNNDNLEKIFWDKLELKFF